MICLEILQLSKNLGHCVSHFLISSVSIDSQISVLTIAKSPIIYCTIVTILFCSLMINVLLDDFVVALIAKTSASKLIFIATFVAKPDRRGNVVTLVLELCKKDFRH